MVLSKPGFLKFRIPGLFRRAGTFGEKQCPLTFYCGFTSKFTWMTRLRANFFSRHKNYVGGKSEEIGIEPMRNETIAMFPRHGP